MAKKRYKKRHYSASETAKRQMEQERIADEKDRAKKRMDPAARALLFADLIFLALSAILERQGLLSPELSGICTLLGAVLLLIALWLQFRGKSGGVKGPRL